MAPYIAISASKALRILRTVCFSLILRKCIRIVWSTFVDFDIIVAIYNVSIDVETVFDFVLFGN